MSRDKIEAEIDRLNVRESFERQLTTPLHSNLIRLQEDLSKAYHEYVSYMDAKEYVMAAAAIGRMCQVGRQLHSMETLLVSNAFSLNAVLNKFAKIDGLEEAEAELKKSQQQTKSVKKRGAS